MGLFTALFCSYSAQNIEILRLCNILLLCTSYRKLKQDFWREIMQTNETLVGRIEIEDLVKKYCFYFDTNQPEKLVDLFSEDACIDYGPEVAPLHGKSEAFTMISRGLTNLFAQTSHHISNFILDFDSDDLAHSVSYIYAWHRYQDKEEIGYLWGQYHHKFTRENGSWKISDLKLFAVNIDNFHRATMHPVDRKQ